MVGLIGRWQNPPPQFGQTLWSTFSAQSAQNVHSKLQMRASTEFAGNGLLQFSQLGRSSIIYFIGLSSRVTGWPCGVLR